MKSIPAAVPVKTRIRAGSLTQNHNESRQPQPGLAPIYVFEPWRATQ
jgi:hypothetical protein